MNCQEELFKASDYGPSRSVESIAHDFEGISFVDVRVEDVTYRVAVDTSEINDLDRVEAELQQAVNWPVEEMNPSGLYGLN